MISCIIIEDEPFAQEVLADYIKEVPQLSLKAIFNNAISAKEYLRDNNVDMLFLDINMPEISGITFFKSLLAPPKVIFTTAYSEYAVEGFELNAIDYLLKPFSFERFEKAIDKAFQIMDIAPTDKLTINVDKKLHRISFDQIVLLESCGDYVKIHLETNTFLVHETLKGLIQRMPSNFKKAHRSYVINMDRIETIEGNLVKLGKHKIPIGISYKEQLLKLI